MSNSRFARACPWMRGLPAGETVGPCADAGYYAVVKPLAVGEHVIEIQGTLGELEVDATYEITVSRRAEPRFAAAAAALEHLVAAAARKRAWPRLTPGRSLRTIRGREGKRGARYRIEAQATAPPFSGSR